MDCGQHRATGRPDAGEERLEPHKSGFKSSSGCWLCTAEPHAQYPGITYKRGPVGITPALQAQSQHGARPAVPGGGMQQTKHAIYMLGTHRVM